MNWDPEDETSEYAPIVLQDMIIGKKANMRNLNVYNQRTGTISNNGVFFSFDHLGSWFLCFISNSHNWENLENLEKVVSTDTA